MSTDDDYKVPPLSWAAIGQKAEGLRRQFNLMNTPKAPVMNLIELVLPKLNMLDFQVGSRAEMGAAYGYTSPDGRFIMLREDVYEAAWNGDGRARFTAAHELGHWHLHANVPLARAKRGDGTKQYCLAEPQANQFAAQFLMPRAFISRSDTETDLIDRFGVSYESASLRLRYLRDKRLI